MTIAAIVVAVSACSVSGEPVRTPDLGARATPSDAFPYGPGLPVPAAGVVSDITFRPATRADDPDDCTPVQVDRATAQVRVGPGGPAGGTLTSMVVRAGDGLDDFVSQVRRCDRFRLGGTVGTTVATTVEDTGDGFVRLERHLVMGPQSDTATPPTTAVTEFVAQRGDIRLYVQNRRSGLDALSGDEFDATRTLFDVARKHAFGA